MQTERGTVKPRTLEIAVRRPGGTRVVQDYLAGAEAVRPFLGPGFTSLDHFSAKVREVEGRFGKAERARAARAILPPDDPALAGRLERFVEKEGFMVTTGQQPGLFGGPLYGILKALTAVRLAEVLEARLDRPVLPVFWVASDDHDWDEANHTYLAGTDNELHRLELTEPEGGIGRPLHRIRLGDDIGETLDSFLALLPGSEFRGRFEALLSGAFTPDGTLPGGYHATLKSLLEPFGLLFTDAAHPVVKEASAPVLIAEMGRAEEMEEVLSRTARRLDAAGYDLQVPLLPGGVNLFLEGPAGRERLYVDLPGFRMRGSGTAVSEEEVRRRFAEDAKVLSPNVLLRPVVESVVFPTLSYVAGPGEMAYFAQLGEYFEAHGVRMPVVFPRFAATPIEGKVRKVLEKFELEPEALQRPFHEIASDLAKEETPSEIRAAIGKLRGAMAQGVSELQSATQSLDPTLKGPVQHVRSQAFAALDELERKVHQAVKREAEIALSQLEKAQLHLFPNGKPAERVQNPFYFLARYGEGFLDDLYEDFSIDLS